jgi:hypothetical protein
MAVAAIRSYAWGYLALSLLGPVAWALGWTSAQEHSTSVRLAAMLVPFGAVIASAEASLRPIGVGRATLVAVGGIGAVVLAVALEFLLEPLIAAVFGLVPIWMVLSWAAIGTLPAPHLYRLVRWRGATPGFTYQTCVGICAGTGAAMGLGLFALLWLFPDLTPGGNIEDAGLTHMFTVPALLIVSAVCHLLGALPGRTRTRRTA